MTRQQLCSIGLATAALGVPTIATAHMSCGQDARHACGVKSPAKIDGTVATTASRHYYVFRAVEGTKLRVSILDTENPACFANEFELCGTVTAKLLGSGLHKLAAITSTPFPPFPDNRPRSVSRTIRKAGDYYIVVRGAPGEATPIPGPGGQGSATPLPLSYQLRIKASPEVHRTK